MKRSRITGGGGQKRNSLGKKKILGKGVSAQRWPIKERGGGKTTLEVFFGQ